MKTREELPPEERTHIPVPHDLKSLLDEMQLPTERRWETYSRVIKAGIAASQNRAIAANIAA